MRKDTVLHYLGKIIFALPVLVSGAFLFPESAFADLRVCNLTTNPVSVALGYRGPSGWQSEGWWVTQPTECAAVLSGDLTQRYFYFHIADDIVGGVWDGSVFMCTQDGSFTIFGVEDCLARGYDRTGFFELDTENKKSWTLQLTDSFTSGVGQE